MQIESLLKQIPSVGLANHEQLAQFLVTWGGATPADAYGRANSGAEAAQPLEDDQALTQSDMSAPEAAQGTARPKRRAVTPGLPPRVAKWEQMQSVQRGGDKPAR